MIIEKTDRYVSGTYYKKCTTATHDTSRRGTPHKLKASSRSNVEQSKNLTHLPPKFLTKSSIYRRQTVLVLNQKTMSLFAWHTTANLPCHRNAKISMLASLSWISLPHNVSQLRTWYTVVAHRCYKQLSGHLKKWNSNLSKIDCLCECHLYNTVKKYFYSLFKFFFFSFCFYIFFYMIF